MSEQISDIQIIRGETPANISETCHRLCAKFISGVWEQVSSHQLIIRRITGGYCNQLYHCSLPEEKKPLKDEPKQAVIRLYGQKHFNSDSGQNERLNDVVISLMVSEHDLGPKLYGLFSGGEVQEYIKCHEFRLSEQKDLLMVRSLARKLARVHSLKVPIRKAEDWIHKTLVENYSTAQQNFAIEQMINEMNLKTLKNNDLKCEIDWIDKCISATKSPNVFCHNDFRANNILVREANNKVKGNELVFCDFEYSCYGYRGIDFGSLFAEWGTQFGKLEYLEFGQFPDDSFLQRFFNDYVEESDRINGSDYGLNEINSMKQLLKEVKVFTLVSLLFSITFLMKVDDRINKKKFMKGADFGFAKYFKLKEGFRKENSIPD